MHRIPNNNKTNMRAIKRGFVLVAAIVLAFFMLTSCGTKSQIKNDMPKEKEFSASGHILYGYKHDLMVYGQYMDRAGENNAMVLVFVESEKNSFAYVKCESISVNGVEVETSITTETISPQLSAIQIDLISSVTNMDQLGREDEIAIKFEIVDKQSSAIIEVTKPIIFSCN